MVPKTAKSCSCLVMNRATVTVNYFSNMTGGRAVTNKPAIRAIIDSTSG